MRPLVALAAALLLAGCHRANHASPPPPGGDTYRVELQLAGEPPYPSLKDVAVTARVAAGGEPLADAEVQLELTMPAMAMPPNRETLTPAGAPGEYAGTVLFTMGGAWDIAATVEGETHHFRCQVK